MFGPPTEVWAFHVIDSPRRSPEVPGGFTEALNPGVTELPVQLRRRLSWRGDPASEIVREAEAGDVDLVILGVRGHGALMRFLVGSVSSAVLRRTERSVLLFPPRLYERWARRPQSDQPDSADAIPLTRIPRGERGGTPRRMEWERWRDDAPHDEDLQDPPEPLPVA